MALPSTVATCFQNAAAITPSDTVANSFLAVYVGTAGNLAVQMANGQLVTFTAVPAGTVLPIATALVKTTGTTAGSLVGLS